MHKRSERDVKVVSQPMGDIEERMDEGARRSYGKKIDFPVCLTSP